MKELGSTGQAEDFFGSPEIRAKAAKPTCLGIATRGGGLVRVASSGQLAAAYERGGTKEVCWQHEPQ